LFFVCLCVRDGESRFWGTAVGDYVNNFCLLGMEF